jgi:hypothetical protein
MKGATYYPSAASRWYADSPNSSGSQPCKVVTTDGLTAEIELADGTRLLGVPIVESVEEVNGPHVAHLTEAGEAPGQPESEAPLTPPAPAEQAPPVP